MRKHFFWAAPLLLVLLAGLVGLLTLPSFVAAPAHRAMVERFASQLTGRDVHISGKLSLSYLPKPQIIAAGITISGPDHEVITARALSLDVALKALLRGRFGVSALNLDSPVISLPWPIPAGIEDIAPPPWLAALHARINNGQIHIGALSISGVEANILTGANGRVRITGTGALNHDPMTLTLNMGQTALIGGTALTADATYNGIKAHLDGTLDTHSLLAGALSVQTPQGISGQTHISLNATSLKATDLSLKQNNATLVGSAQLTFSPLRLTASLTGQQLALDHLSALRAAWPAPLSGDITLNAGPITLAGHDFPDLQANLAVGPDGIAVHNLVLDMNAAAKLKGDFMLAPDGALSGHLDLTAPDAEALSAHLGLPANTDWPTAIINTNLAGTITAPDFTDITALLGRDHMSGHVFLSAHHAAFQLHFDHVALLKLAPLLRQPLSDNTHTIEGETTIAQADAGPLKLENLLIDAAFNKTLNIRRVSANLYGGMVMGNLVLDHNLNLTNAHLILNLPSATPVDSFIAPYWKLPHSFLNQPLSLVANATNKPDALAVTTKIQLGDLALTLTPLINLAKQSVTGALSFKAPNAIAILKLLGQNAACTWMAPLPNYPFQHAALPCLAEASQPGLAFPGPGSISLRAHFSIAPDSAQLTDFVFNAGLLNGAGQLNWQKGQLNGQIEADTLALPALPHNLQMPDTFPLSGQISLSAGHILYAGQNVLGTSSGTLTITPTSISLTNIKASLGGGNLSGDASLKLVPRTMPIVTAKLEADHVEASALNLPQAFPLRLAKGQISASANLTATGYTPKTWAATLNGTATLTANKGELEGLSLPDIITALKAVPPQTSARGLEKGNTPFTTLNMTATFSQGNCTLTQAELNAPSGSLSAIGGIDLFDASLALRVQAHPALNPALTLTTRLIGSWAHPSRVNDISAALNWHAAH